MTRCDFASVSAILLDNIKSGFYENSRDFFDDIFGAFFADQAERNNAAYERGEYPEDLYIDDAKLSRWFSGKNRLPAEIRKYYSRTETAQEDMAVTLADIIFPCLFSPEATAEQIHDLIVWDGSVNPHQRDLLCAQRDTPENFIAAVLIFAVTRRFSSTADISPNASPDIESYIHDAGVPRLCRNFFGRDEDISQLDEALADEGKVFLQGIAGIGKSELARAYAQRFRTRYTNMLYIFYSGSLRSDIANLNFCDDRPDDREDERFKKHLRFLKTLRPDTLLIIDNFNTTADADDTLPEILRLRCRVLFTTKCVFEDYRTYELKELGNADLLDLFFCYSGNSVSHETAEAMIRTVHCHTLAVELAAKLVKKGVMSPEHILKKLAEEHAAYDGTDRISVSKDGISNKGTYAEQIRTLFRMHELDTEKSNVMRMMAMIPLYGIHMRKFAVWTKQKDMNTVNELIEMGFICCSDDMISLHPLLQEAVIAELCPADTSCLPLMTCLERICSENHYHVPDYNLICQTVVNIMVLAKHDRPDFYQSFVFNVAAGLQDYSHSAQLKALNEEYSKIMKDADFSFYENAHDCFAPYTRKKVIALANREIEHEEITRQNFLRKIHFYVILSRSCRYQLDATGADIMIRRAVVIYQQFSQCVYPSSWYLMLTFRLEHARVMNDLGKAQEGLRILEPYRPKMQSSNIEPFCRLEYFLTLAILTANAGQKRAAEKILTDTVPLCNAYFADDEERITFYVEKVILVLIALIRKKKREETILANLPDYYDRFSDLTPLPKCASL